jgi:hypothetical protein
VALPAQRSARTAKRLFRDGVGRHPCWALPHCDPVGIDEHATRELYEGVAGHRSRVTPAPAQRPSYMLRKPAASSGHEGAARWAWTASGHRGRAAVGGRRRVRVRRALVSALARTHRRRGRWGRRRAGPARLTSRCPPPAPIPQSTTSSRRSRGDLDVAAQRAEVDAGSLGDGDQGIEPLRVGSLDRRQAQPSTRRGQARSGGGRVATSDFRASRHGLPPTTTDWSQHRSGHQYPVMTCGDGRGECRRCGVAAHRLSACCGTGAW